MSVSMDHGEGIGTFREALEQLYVLHSCEIQGKFAVNNYMLVVTSAIY